MLTEQQREAAARELCRLRGIDPDSQQGDNQAHGGAYYVCKAWENAAAEILAHEQIHAAIEVGMRTQPKGTT